MNSRLPVLLSACCLLLSGIAFAALARVSPDSDDLPGSSAAFAFEDPDAAAKLYQTKRRVTDGASHDFYSRYRDAMDRMGRMQRYSSRSGRYGDDGQDQRLVPQGTGDKSRLEIWEPLGPGNIGGRTRALLLDPRDPDTMYTAGVSGGIWKTTSGGRAWEALADMLPNIAVSAMAMDPSDPRTLYAGTGEGHFREIVRGTGLPLRGAGIFKSEDAGLSWHRLENTHTSDFHWVNDLIVSSRDPDRLYTATRSGVWRSADAGQNWVQVLATSLMGGCFDLVQRNDTATDFLLVSCGTFGVPGQSAIYRQTQAESDLPWHLAYSELGMGRTSLAIAPSRPDRVYALSASYLRGNHPDFNFNGGLHAVFRSDSGGAPGSWITVVKNSDTTQLNTLILSNPYIGFFGTCGFGPGSDRASNLGWYTNVIAVDPVSPGILWAGGVDLFRSDDGGRNWGLVSYWWNSPPSLHADQHALTFHPDYDGNSNQTLFVGGDGGVWRTDNARAKSAGGQDGPCKSTNTDVTWAPLNKDLGITQFYHGAPFPDGARYLGGTQDNGTLIGGDETGQNGWSRLLGGDGGYVAVDPENPDVIYAETQLLNLFKSTDGGKSFAPARSGIRESSAEVLFITPFVMDPADSSRLWTGGRRVWRTVNGAQNWSQASADLSGGGRVSALSVSRVNSNHLLVGREDGVIHRQSQALTSDSASSWPRSQPRSGFVTWLAHDPLDQWVAYATYAGFGGSHVWKTGDGGVTWSPIDGQGTSGLPDIPVHSLLIDPQDRQRLFLGTDLGVFVSTVGGKSMGR